MKLRLDEYYYILNVNYGWEEIEEYMPDDMSDKYLKCCESHNSDEIDDYLHNLYSYIEVINLEYNIIDNDLEKAYTEYTAIVKINNKYYSFDWYYTWNWNFEDRVDVDMELTEVTPKEVTTTIYEVVNN